MSQFLLFFGITKIIFPSIFSHFSSHLSSQLTFEINFPKSADLWLIQMQQIFYRKINTIEVFWFLILITPVFSSVTIWYPMNV